MQFGIALHVVERGDGARAVLEPRMGRDVLDPLTLEPDLALLLAQAVEVLPSRPRCHRVPLPLPITFAAYDMAYGKASALLVQTAATGGGRQLVEQRLRLLEIRRVETLGEPAIDRSEDVMGFAATALVATQPGEAHGGAQFPKFGFLLPGN